ncbi:uncharacterized protein EV420DRAFT_1634758 [Desarmillaria tabescens]|uniref:F-box domain-containing protein n=1 Tax=Armillaria tabescens TaxID=1929756 RepID=A0AA39NRG7_ARMTA|nr:uncharacterized protein EV420DRAFT_1634758 [Desarmillaria tabescens]KAK0470330.1 hypothetical protein EV420DRAFT_1634758 [Desarmillaria tabescens]
MESPRIFELFRSNQSPLDSESGEFMRILAASQDRKGRKGILGALQSKIDATQGLLDFLKGQKSIAESNEADAVKILRQHRILNSDYLTSIFQQCLDDVHPFGPSKGANCLNPVRRAPCVNLDFGAQYEGCDYSKRLFRLGIFLVRSRGYPLRIRLRSQWDISANRIFQALLPTSSRWTDTYFSLLSKSFRSLSTCKAFFSRLERLQVSLAVSMELGLDTFGMALNIRACTTNITQPFLVFSHFPGANVHSYSSFSGSFREQISALTCLPNVRDLVLRCQKSDIDLRSPATLIHVQSLDVFEIYHPGNVSQTLDNLVFPSLKKLRTMLVAEVPSFPAQLYLGHITSLELTCRLSYDEDIDAFFLFLAPLMQLETLSIHAPRIPETLIYRLRLSPGSDQVVRYVPWLKCLDLRRSTFADEKSGTKAFLLMVESRRTNDAKELREVCLERP